MKCKFLKVFAYSVLLIFGLFNNIHAEYKVQYSTREQIRVTGAMSSDDLNNLSLSILESVKSIDLSDITMIPDSNGVTRTPCYRFCGTNDTFYNLETVIFPKNLQEIVGSFNSLPSLKNVTLPKDLKLVLAFQNCPNLKLFVPAGVKCGCNFTGSPGVRPLKKESNQKFSIISVASSILSLVGL